jgi:hypothetical protein
MVSQSVLLYSHFPNSLVFGKQKSEKMSFFARCAFCLRQQCKAQCAECRLKMCGKFETGICGDCTSREADAAESDSSDVSAFDLPSNLDEDDS